MISLINNFPQLPTLLVIPQKTLQVNGKNTTKWLNLQFSENTLILTTLILES